MQPPPGALVDPHLSSLQAVDPGILTVCALVALSIAVVVSDVVVGPRDYRRFLRDEAEHGEAARVRFYRRWVRYGVTTAIVAVLVVVALPGIGLSTLGLRLPDLSNLVGSGFQGGAVAGAVVGAAVAVLVGGAVLVVRTLRTRAAASSTAPPIEPSRPLDPRVAALAPMFPRTSQGRRGWAALSFSAGIGGEITYRGVLLLTLAVVLPAATPSLVLVALAAAIFGLAHGYQGRAGMISASAVGAVLAATYLVTGSLLLPMVLHTLIDLRVLLIPVSSFASRGEPG